MQLHRGSSEIAGPIFLATKKFSATLERAAERDICPSHLQILVTLFNHVTLKRRFPNIRCTKDFALRVLTALH